MPSIMKSVGLAVSADKKEEIGLAYFHGALMDQDVDALLRNEGDFLLQMKPTKKERNRLLLAVRGSKNILRAEVKRNEKGQVKIDKKLFDSIMDMLEYYQKNSCKINDEKIKLKKAIPRGKFQMYHADVKIIKKIGSGAYGTVYRGVLRRTDQTIAIKRIDSEGADDQALTEMMKEARVMQLYDHRNIVRFFGFIVDRMPYLLVMEFCDGGSVEDKLRNQGKKISIATRVDWCAQAAAGMEYLHSKECIHRDIATRNCLLDRGVVKMGDFGMCRPTSVYKVDVSKPMNVRWLAPEVWKIAETRYNTDVFAFAVTIWEMFEIPYKTPYENLKAIEVKNKTVEGYRLQPSEYMPEGIVEVMELAWHQDVAKRPDARKLRKMLDEINAKMSDRRKTSSAD